MLPLLPLLPLVASSFLAVAAPQAIVADFEASPRVGPAALVVHFRDLSNGPVLHRSWDFGDGTLSGERDPVHTYTSAGQYTVTLTVRSRVGSDTRVAEDFVQVAPRALPLGTPNIALIVLDDIGLDRLAVYGETPAGHRPACTPNLDALAAEGLLFRRAYANPLCSPTRAQILTGRHGFRTGIGGPVTPNGKVSGLSARLEFTLPELLEFHDSAAIGKWHLAGAVHDGLQHPLRTGYDHFAGTLYNPAAPPIDFGAGALDCSFNGPLGYYSYAKTWDRRGRGELEQTCETTYLTIDTTDDALAHARRASALGPWFLHVNYNAGHLPLDPPPDYLAPSSALCGNDKSTPGDALGTPLADLVLEALDTELGRLIAGLRALDPDVLIVLTSDNGSDHRAALGERDSCFGSNRSKGTLFEGGVRVPLLFAGAGVVPGECEALVSATDLFATFAELTGAAAQAEDSVSLVPYLRGERAPRRDFVYAEYFRPNFVTPDAPKMPPFAPELHLRMVSDGRFKLMRYTDAKEKPVERLYDLREDPCEQRSLHTGHSPIDPAELPPLIGARYLALQAELVRLGVY